MHVMARFETVVFLLVCLYAAESTPLLSDLRSYALTHPIVDAQTARRLADSQHVSREPQSPEASEAPSHAKELSLRVTLGAWGEATLDLVRSDDLLGRNFVSARIDADGRKTVQSTRAAVEL